MPSKSKKSSSHRPTQVPNPPKTLAPTIASQNPETGSTLPDMVNGHSRTSQTESELRTGDTTESAGEPTSGPTVNRKKQKRREKEAAKKEAVAHITDEQYLNGHALDTDQSGEQIPQPRQGRGPVKGYFTEEPDYVDDGFQDSLVEPEDAFYSGDEDVNYAHDYVEDSNNSWLNTSKRKKGLRSRPSHSQHHTPSRTSSGVVRSALPALSNAAIRSAHKMSNDHIWNTSTQAERENIKQFWLELGEEERRSLVKVEKEAVLRKMKEQQKHSCSCSVCGRKRTAIEEELEVLYDAYYEELEQFANHNNDIPNSPQVMPPPQTYRPLRTQTHPMAGSYPVTGRIRELGDNGEEFDDEDEYEDEEDEEPYSDEDYDDDLPPGPPDFFQFGNSLTVKDGILTVADDLLKNDGKHFIDMMEQLAERRMQREEEIHYPAPPLAHQNLGQGHNHPPIDEDDDYDDDEDEDEDYDSQEEDDFEGDEMDSMTEEQRMEEGRRMFQIFAARMFEQRVLTAYREKVAAERQRKLLEELDEESRLDTQREAKKAREAAKRKEKKARQKAAKDEEKARKDAEKAAQEAATKEAEERRLEEQKQRKEEQRKKRDAERKAAEEERIRKEVEKQRRLQEERERQVESERKQRETREREKKKRDEARKKEREDREAREKEAKEEKKLKDEKERKAKEQQARSHKEAIVKVDKETRSRHEQTTKPQPVALPPGLHPAPRNSHLQSPHAQTATPIVSSAVPTPNRNRQPSQPSQASHTSSPRSQQASTDISQPSASPAATMVPPTQGFVHSSKPPGPQPPLHHPQPAAPRSPLNHAGRGGQYPFHVNGIPGLGVSGPSAAPNIMPGVMPPMPMYQGPPMGNHHHRFAPNGMSYPPGFGGPRPFQSTHPIAYQQQHPNHVQRISPPVPSTKTVNHSRQPSGSEQNHHQAPIARLGPIARPSSTTPDKQKTPDAEVEQITTQLGSKALLDDSDEPIIGSIDSRTNLAPVGAPGSVRLPFASTFPETKHNSFGMGNPGWNSFSPSLPGASWGAPGSRPSPSWSQPPFGGIVGGVAPMNRPHAPPRPIAVRLTLVQACRRLSAVHGNKADGFHPVSAVLQQVEQLKAPGEPPVTMDEMLTICDTEGNVQNGGGSFEVVRDNGGGQLVKYVDDSPSGPSRIVGDIGSPLQTQGPGQNTSFGSIGQGMVGQGFGAPGRHF